MNKLPWFTHDHNAHEDEFIQKSMDQFGHFGYSAYFITLELIHKHGVGDRLIMGASRYASRVRSRMDRVKDWLSFSERSGKLSWKLSGNDIEIKIKMFRERQSKLKSNLPSTFRQPSVNLPIEEEGERERERDIKPPIPPKGGAAKSKHKKKPEEFPEFEIFWTAYPRKVSKISALKSWVNISPDESLTQKILKAVEQQKNTEQWTKDGGQFIPHPATWLNQKRWEDEVNGASTKGGSVSNVRTQPAAGKYSGIEREL